MFQFYQLGLTDISHRVVSLWARQQRLSRKNKLPDQDEDGMSYEGGWDGKASTIMNRTRPGRAAVGPRRRPSPAGIAPSPPHSASSVILRGQWLSLKEKYWHAGQSGMSGADLQFICHHYLMLQTQGWGRRPRRETRLTAPRMSVRDDTFLLFMVITYLTRPQCLLRSS